MRKSKRQQLEFVFAESPQGVGPSRKVDVSTGREGLAHQANPSQRRESTPPPVVDTSRLLEFVAAPENLESALRRVVANKGAPGVDGKSVEEVDREKDLILPKLRHALLTETYVPGDVRRVWIPKPGGGQRALGIPNVVDRWVQTAVLQILEPIFEPSFHPSSHGFRPERSCQSAITTAKEYVKEGCQYTVDIDLEKFFDQVNHQRLLDRMSQLVKDRRVLRIVRLMLKAEVVLPNGVHVASEEGTPQGGPLSPFLSNIVLDELDQELERRGLRFVRYADDCNIYVRSERAGHRVMDSIGRFIEGRLRLKVNRKKSAVARSGRRHFVGFLVGPLKDGEVAVRLSPRSVKRLSQRIRELTPRNWGNSLQHCMDRVSGYLKGWIGFFWICSQETRRLFRAVDAHIRRRLRAIVIRQRKRSLYLLRHLSQHGAGWHAARMTAYSRRGVWFSSRTYGISLAYRNRWFQSRLASLEELWLKRASARGGLD